MKPDSAQTASVTFCAQTRSYDGLAVPIVEVRGSKRAVLLYWDAIEHEVLRDPRSCTLSPSTTRYSVTLAAPGERDTMLCIEEDVFRQHTSLAMNDIEELALAGAEAMVVPRGFVAKLRSMLKFSRPRHEPRIVELAIC